MKKILLLPMLAFFSFSCSDFDRDEEEEIIMEDISVVDTHYFKADIDGYDLSLEEVIYNQFPKLEENYHENHYFSFYGGTWLNVTTGTIDGVETQFCLGATYRSGIAYSKFDGEYNSDLDGDYDERNFDDIELRFRNLSHECSAESELEALKMFLEKESFEFATNKYSINDKDVNNNSIEVQYAPAKTTGITTKEEIVVYSTSSGDNSDMEFKITDYSYGPAGTYNLDQDSSVSNELNYSYEFEIYGEVTCKLYKIKDDEKFLQLNNGKFKMVFRTNF